MSYINLNNPANFQLQEFGQMGFRVVTSDFIAVPSEQYRTLYVLEDAVVTATTQKADDLTSKALLAGTIIHGLFNSVSVASGRLLAYSAGRISAQEILALYEAYVIAAGGILEGTTCAVEALSELGVDTYADASLVLIPEGYKTGVLYGQRPLTSDSQLDFTRASNATRVNSSGLIEKVRTNLLTYSNTFSNGAWTKILSTVTGGQDGYDGTNNAWLLQITDPSGRLEGFPFLSNLVTLSVYAKAGTTNVLTLTQLNSNSYITCDLSNGTFTGQGGDVVYRDIESVGSGWYRIQLASRGTTLTGIKITPVGIAGDNVYIQDVQLEYGDIATDYIETTTSAVSTFAGITVNGTSAPNIPRLDYTDSTCPKLLLEPQRTNLALYSEDFSNAAWTKAAVGGGTAPVVTKNYTTAPDGYSSADRIQFNPSASGASYIYNTASLSFSTYGAFTIYAKSLTEDVQTIIIKFGAYNQTYSVGPEWQRLTYLNFGAGTGNFIIGNGTSIGGSIYSSDVALWGAQAEDATYPTSYIPTYEAAVTRVADSALKTGIASLIGQTEGTIFCEVDLTSRSTFSYFAIATNLYSTNAYIGIGITASAFSFEVVNSGVQVAYNFPNSSTGTFKLAFAYKANDFVAYVNGVQVHSDTSGTVPACSQLGLNAYNTAASWNYNQALLFKTRLTNAQLAELTTL
jgi:hypothetical protein